MFKISVNSKYKFEIDTDKGRILADGAEIALDMKAGTGEHFHIIRENKSYRAEVVTFSHAEKTCTIRVNGNDYHLDVKDQFDELLHRLGMDTLNKTKIAELKAPMPGMVLKVLVREGDVVKKGDNILVLEAMKMENIIKSPADVTIKVIKIKPSDKVEKNQIMILFE
ncbi:biotin/lipoyl-binding protein [Flavihumibacter sp. R14]|nr:biotin/lipoyl-binding protein [Flavihumibacter soli]